MKECVAMLLAGGQGSRLYALTRNLAKPAVPFGGKYRIIDFPLSNCVNSGIDTVGILTQYQPLVAFIPPARIKSPEFCTFTSVTTSTGRLPLYYCTSFRELVDSLA